MLMKRKFAVMLFVVVLFTSTSAYAINQADVVGKINEILDGYLTKIVEKRWQKQRDYQQLKEIH